MQNEINRINWRPSEYEAETPLGHAIEESGEVDG